MVTPGVPFGGGWCARDAEQIFRFCRPAIAMILTLGFQKWSPPGVVCDCGYDALALQTKNPDFVILVFRTLRTIQVLIRNGHPPVCHLGVVGVLALALQTKNPDFVILVFRTL